MFSGNTDIYSQFYESEFTAVVNGNVYTFFCAEQFMMAYKALVFGDKASFAKIMHAKSPAECKRLGRQVAGFIEAVWNAIAEDVVATGNLYKFTQNDLLREKLMADRGYILVEASYWDKKWGTGMNFDATERHITTTGSVPGGNLLGKCIMRARNMIIAEETPADSELLDPWNLMSRV